MLDLGLNAAGALTIGLGVLPVVAGLASLWRAPGEPVTRELRTFRSVLLAAIIGFGLYTAVKATYVSITFATYTYERNLIYLAPLLFTGTALWLERRRLHPIALAVSAAFVLVLILTTPYEMGQDLSYNAPGLAILQQGNRYLQFDPTAAKIGLVALLCFSVALLLAPRFFGRGAKWLVLAVARGGRRLESDRRDLLRLGVEPHLGPLRREHSRAVHVGRRCDRRRIDALPRPADVRSERRVAARVLEPLDQGRVEPRRNRAGARPLPHTRSGRRQRSPFARPRLSVRRRGTGHRGRRQDGRDAPTPCRRRARAVAARQDHAAAPAARFGHRRLLRRLDELVQRLHALFDRGEQGRPDSRDRLQSPLGRHERDGTRDRGDRADGGRRRQATSPREADGSEAIRHPQQGSEARRPARRRDRASGSR